MNGIKKNRKLHHSPFKVDNITSDHYRVVLYLFFKASLGAQPLKRIKKFPSHANKTHFHMKGCASGFPLNKRQKTTREMVCYTKRLRKGY